MRLPASSVVTVAPALNLAPADEVRGIRDLQPPGSFARLLRRERARADRMGREFTVVILRPAEEDSPRAILRVARALAARARETDEVGWLSESALYALLPETAAAGAWQLADDVCDAVRVRFGRPNCLVYGYPGVGKTDALMGVDMPLRRHNDAEPPRPAMKLHRDDLIPFMMAGFEQEMREGRASARPLRELLL